MTEPEWQCESCDELQTGDPAGVETYPGHEGPAELMADIVAALADVKRERENE